MPHPSQLHILDDRAECLSLLRTVPVGRIVFTECALPAIQPVNFTLDGASLSESDENELAEELTG